MANKMSLSNTSGIVDLTAIVSTDTMPGLVIFNAKDNEVGYL